MNILVVSQWFPPEPGGGPARFLEMAAHWQRRGHRVTVLAGIPNWPTGKVVPGYEGRLLVRERYQGLPVLRSWVYATPNEGVLKRILNHTSFLVTGPLTTLTLEQRPDVVVATSPPLFAAVAGLAIAKRFRAPFIFDVRDLWPDAIFALGQMQRPGVRGGLRYLERLLYRKAALVVAVSPRFEESILKRGASRVEVIPNGADLEAFAPGPPDTEIRRAWGWEDKFVVLYAGTLGMAHGLGTVLEAAELVRDLPVHFALVGEGAERDHLEQEARGRGLASVQFLGLQPRTRMPSIYRSADVCLVALRPLSLFDSFIPSKIFEIMACGRPILAAVSGQALDLVTEAGAAIPVEPRSADGLADAVRTAFKSSDLPSMGRAGRRFVEQRFARRALAERYLGSLAEVAGVRVPASKARSRK